MIDQRRRIHARFGLRPRFISAAEAARRPGVFRAIGDRGEAPPSQRSGCWEYFTYRAGYRAEGALFRATGPRPWQLVIQAHVCAGTDDPVILPTGLNISPRKARLTATGKPATRHSRRIWANAPIIARTCIATSNTGALAVADLHRGHCDIGGGKTLTVVPFVGPLAGRSRDFHSNARG